MMTQDRATHPIAAPTSPRNLNPSAPAFRQGQAAPASPKNLNPAAPAFHQSPGGGGDKPPTDGSYPGADTTGQGLLTNGDIYANGTHYMVPLGGNGAVMHQAGGSHPQGVHQVQSPQNRASMGLSGAPHPLLAASTHSSHQAAVPTMSPHQQSMYAMAVQDSMAGQHAAQKQARILSQSSPPAGGMNETGESSPIGAPVGVEEVPSENAAEEDVSLEGATGGQGYKYPDQILAPITNQMQFYFSNENLPNDKFLNQHMDADKFIPLELFLDFGRIKPICNNIDQLIQAVESSSILELSEDRKKVRVSQCRKTLTLRGFPASATEEDVRQFILEMGACVPTHIEFVMFKERYSVWYVSFKDEAAALNSFFQFHNKKAVYRDHNIGCCIKSSGTLAAAGYFPSSEESNQRRLAHQNPAAVAASTAAVHVVQSSIPQPQPQQPQALMQPFSPMQLHHSYMPSSPAGIYYQQTPQGAYMPYMAGMIQGWPNPAAALEPGLIMQNNGLQPQHIHTSMPRPHLLSSGSGAQHRYSRPPRARPNILERSASERPSDRTPVVSVSGPSRSAPRSAEGVASATLVPQGAYMPRRSAARDDMTVQVMSQPQALSHTFVTPMVTQHQHITPPATATAPPPSTTVNPLVIEPMAVSHYQAAPQPHPHQQAGPVLIQQQPMPSSATTSHPPPPPPPQQQTTSNPLPLPPPPQQLQMQQHHHHHHSQPPPAIQHQQQQQQQQQPPHQAAAHHQPQKQQQGPPPHNSQHHMPPPPPPSQPPHHQHTPQMTHTHHPHQHAVVPHHHHAQQQQHHHTVPPPPPHHQQPLQNNRPERKGRRRREDNVRNPRSERNQSNRVNFSCQAPAAADNFTMEANSFPPLPGALSNIANSEISHENRMSDIVRGISRNSVAQRALSTTPSPVATPAPAPLTSGGTLVGQHHGITASALSDVHGLDDRDSPLDDDTTSSSQEEVDTDINSVESRSVRSEPQSVSSGAEQPVFPSQPRSQKATTPVAMSTSSQKQGESRQGSYSMQVQGLGSQQETPKPSYAQILALKNREAANNASAADSVSIGGLPPNSNSGTPNGPGSGHSNNSIATSGSGRAAATTTQPSNAFREHGNYQGGPPQQQLNSRPSQRGPSKDLSRPDGSAQSTRPPNGNRRNSKENRTSNKFDRSKPETRQKQF